MDARAHDQADRDGPGAGGRDRAGRDHGLGAVPRGFVAKRVKVSNRYTRSGWKTVDALVIGQIAVHRDTGITKRWMVTPLPCGLAFPGPLTKRDAVALARRVTKKVDWKQVTRKGHEERPTGFTRKMIATLAADRDWAIMRRVPAWRFY